jgi:hypothetical protein
MYPSTSVLIISCVDGYIIVIISYSTLVSHTHTPKINMVIIKHFNFLADT